MERHRALVLEHEALIKKYTNLEHLYQRLEADFALLLRHRFDEIIDISKD